MKKQLTHRQVEVWSAYLDDDFNHPSRTDYYLMYIVKILLKNKTVKLSDLKLDFGKSPETSQLAAMKASKNKWISATRGK